MLVQLDRRSLFSLRNRGEILVETLALPLACPFPPVRSQTQLLRAFCRKIPAMHPRHHTPERGILFSFLAL